MEVKVLRHEDLPEGLDPMGEGIRFTTQGSAKVWIPESTAPVLGNSQKPEVELNLANVIADSLPVYKRHGGGGTVLLSPKGFCFAIRFPKISQNHIADYFDRGTGYLKNYLLESYQLETLSRGISDLCIGNLKILGCSLYMPKECVVYLASVLFEEDIDQIERYLAHPSKEPDYRAGRGHRQFLTFLSEHLPKDILLQQFVKDFERYLTKQTQSLNADF